MLSLLLATGDLSGRTGRDQDAWKVWMKTAEAKFHQDAKFKDFDEMYATVPFEGFYDDVVTKHG